MQLLTTLVHYALMKSVVGVAAALAIHLAHVSVLLGAVGGEGVNKNHIAVRTDRAPVIDGRLDDDVWAQAPADDRFTQTFPDEGKPPTMKTEWKALYDDENVYFAVRMYDPDPDGIVARLTRRDRDIEADWLAIYIDTRHDHNTAFVFQVQASGVLVDGAFLSDNNFTLDWDAVWSGASARDAQGWTAEFSIPLTVLRFSEAPVQTWGIDFHRHVSRTREEMHWTFKPSEVQGTVSRFGHVTGLTGLKPRRTFELRPYASARFSGRAAEGWPVLGYTLGGDADYHFDLGVDGKLGLTRGLTLDLTVNPDFGQVEADQVVLNLSRFETFFPEKRPFFLEGRDVFESPIQLFYPRRIGRPAVGRIAGDTIFVNGMPREISVADPMRIWAAAKVTGVVAGKLQVGALGALTGPETVEVPPPAGVDADPEEIELAPERTYGALRLRWGGTDSIGVMATAVNRLGGDIYRASANHDAYAQMIDATWANDGGTLRGDAQLVLSERVGGSSFQTADGRPCPGGAGDPSCLPIARADGTRMAAGDVGFGARAWGTYQDRRKSLYVAAWSYSPKLDLNDMGFLQSWDQHGTEIVGVYGNRKASAPFQNWFVIPVAYGTVDYDGVPTNLGGGLDSEALFKNFVYTSPQLFVWAPVWDPFETLDGGYFQRPLQLDSNWYVASNPSKRLVADIRVFGRLNLDREGHFVGAVSGLTWKTLPNLELALAPEFGIERAVRFYDCSTPSGARCLVETGQRDYLFARLDSRYLSLTFRGTYTLSTDLSLQAYAQLFLADGDWSSYQGVSTMGAAPKIATKDLMPSAFDGGDDGFETAALNVNLVLRWEPILGSTLFIVYTRAQFAPTIRPARLDTGPTEDTFLIKFVYFIR